MHLHEDLCGKMVWNMAMGLDMALEPISMCMKVLRRTLADTIPNIPTESMYGRFTYIYHENQLNVSIVYHILILWESN